MKKIILLLNIAACLALVFTSCDNDVENWNSATYEYSGRFVVAAVCQEKPSKNAGIEKGNEIQIYNTAANIANEIWLDDVSGKFPLKGKFRLSGNAAGFSAGEKAANLNVVHYIYNAALAQYIQFVSANKDDFPVPTAINQENVGIQEYTYITLQEGKVLPNVATSVGGNKTDSLYLKITLHTDNIKFKSYLLPAKDWSVPGVPEYEWKPVEGSNTSDAGKDEHWTISGYRYTGYPEDN